MAKYKCTACGESTCLLETDETEVHTCISNKEGPYGDRGDAAEWKEASE